MKAARPAGKISDVFDVLKNRTAPPYRLRKSGISLNEVLVRAITGDDARQSKVAQAELANADEVMVALTALCELVWVLSQGYKIPSAKIAETIRYLMNSANFTANRPAVESGLALLEAGADFADGIVAYEGSWLGADVFLSFDRRAVRMMQARDRSARLLV